MSRGDLSNTIHIIDTSVANIASLRAAFDRLERSTQLTTDPEQVLSAKHLVLPGVGAFSAGLGRLRELEVVHAIKQRIQHDRPTLAVCLGMQMLCESSEESPGVDGLGILPFQVRRFSTDLIVPQLGWNTVQPQIENRFIEVGEAYFANSFRIDSSNDPDENGQSANNASDFDPVWQHAETDYGGKFISSIWRGNVLACQFHPELSGAWGLKLLKRWVDLC